MVDVLAWSDLIMADQSSVPPAASEAAEAIGMVRAVAAESTDAVYKLDPTIELDLRASNFSDTFVLSAKATVQGLVVLTATLASLCQRLLQSDLYTRGGIVRGKVRHTPEALFGPAVIEAHHLESRVAVYPRILITEPVRTVLEPKSKVQEDSDGMFFLDLLSAGAPFGTSNSWLRDRLAIVEAKMIRDREKPERMAKHQWICNRITEALRASAAG